MTGPPTRVGDMSLLVGVDVKEAADTERCLECGDVTFVLVRRGDKAGGDSGMEVMLSGFEMSVVGDLAGFR